MVYRKGEADERAYDLPIDGFFLAIGHNPNTELFKGQLDMDATGYLVTEGTNAAHEHSWCIRRRRCGRSHLSPGDHGGCHGLQGSSRSENVLGRARELSSHSHYSIIIKAPSHIRCEKALVFVPASTIRRRVYENRLRLLVSKMEAMGKFFEDDSSI